MTDITSPAIPTCLNCGCALTDSFCPHCGQQDREIKRPLIGLLRELIHVVFELDGRAYKTLFFLFSRPGYLSREYISGRRASFTPPLRLFLILSITFFFIISLNSFIENLDSSLSSQPGEPVKNRNITEDGDATSIDQNDLNAEDPIAFPGEDRIDLPDENQEEITEIIDFIESIALPLLSAETNANLVAFISTQAKTNYIKNREDPEAFFYGSLDYITFFMLLMMPFLAMILKILYFFSKRFYVEHMILTLHNHTFLILTMIIRMPLASLGEGTILILSPLASLASALLVMWMVIYLFLSLKFYFGQGYLLTTFKFITATISYGILLATGSAVFMILFFIFS
jgi:hypothetical protein